MPRIDDPFGASHNHSARAFMLFSDDEGSSWRKGEALPLVRSAGGRLWWLLRTVVAVKGR